jgi:hypothetical protein
VFTNISEEHPASVGIIKLILTVHTQTATLNRHKQKLNPSNQYDLFLITEGRRRRDIIINKTFKKSGIQNLLTELEENQQMLWKEWIQKRYLGH